MDWLFDEKLMASNSFNDRAEATNAAHSNQGQYDLKNEMHQKAKMATGKFRYYMIIAIRLRKTTKAFCPELRAVDHNQPIDLS